MSVQQKNTRLPRLVSPSVTATPPTPVTSSVSNPSNRIIINGIILEPSPSCLNFLFNFLSVVDFFLVVVSGLSWVDCFMIVHLF